MGEFDDLIPEKAPSPGAFDDLVPTVATAPAAGAFDDLVPASAEEIGTLAGLARSGKLAFKGTAQALDAAKLAELPRGATMRQERRAFERSMADVRYTDPLGAEDVRRLVSPGAQLEQATLGVTTERRELAEKIAVREKEIQSIELSPAMKRWNAAKGKEAVKAFVRDPIEITSNIIVQGITGSLPAVGAAVAGSTVGPAGTALGAGSGSLAVEYSNKLLNSMREAGVDLTDADQVDRAFRDPARLAAMKEKAVDRAVPVALFDAFSAGIAGKFVGGAVGTRQTVKAGVKEAAVQAGTGAAGELAGQLAADEKISGKEIFSEAIGELGPGAVEVGVNALRAGAQRAAPATSQALAPRITELQPPEPATLEQALQQADHLAVGPQPTVPAKEVQTSGEPETETVSELADRRMFPVVEVALGQLSLSQDVPNFKADADETTGVVQGQQLEGKYERLGTGAITVWERQDGRREVISGRHRFDLARRSGERTIPAQVVREKEGFTKEMAMTLDAEMNIRDGQGTVGDYANYFRNTAVSEEEARARGLLSRAKGQAGWALGKNAGDDLYALYRAGKVNEAQAVAIATAAPGETALQRVGSKAAINGAGPQELANFIQAVRYKTKNAPAEQLDLFGANDAAMNEAERLAKVATQLQRELDKEIKATDNAVRNAELAKSKGLRFDRDPQEILAENAKLRVLRRQWDNWALHPELVAKVTGIDKPGSEAILQESGNPPAISQPTEAQMAESLTGGTQGELFGSLASENTSAQAEASPLPIEQAELIRQALVERNPAAFQQLFGQGDTVSSILAKVVRREIPQFDIRGQVIKSPLDFALLSRALRSPYFETFKVAILNQRGKVVYSQVLTAGNLDSTVFDLNGIVKAIEIGRQYTKTPRLVLAHNHPSGHPSPSSGDIQCTDRVRKTCRDLGVDFVDHIITNGTEFFSFRAGGSDFIPKEYAANAVWEVVTRTQLATIDSEERLKHLAGTLRNADPNHHHIMYLTTRRTLTAVERVPEWAPIDEIVRRVTIGAAQEGANAILLDLTSRFESGAGEVPDGARLLVDQLKRRVYGVAVVDAATPSFHSLRSAGYISEPAGAYGEPGDTLREEPERPERQFTQKVLDPESGVSSDVKNALPDSAIFYTPRSNETDAQVADRFITTLGMDNAIAEFKDTTSAMHGAVRTAVGLALIKRLGQAEQYAAMAGNRIEEQEAIAKQVDLVEHVSSRATEIAQSLQAMAMWARMTPAGHLRAARRIFHQAAERVLVRLRPALTDIKDVLVSTNGTTAEAVTATVEVRQAVDRIAGDAVAGARAVQNAIVIEVSGVLGSSPAVVQLIRQRVQAFAGEDRKREVINQLQTILARHYVDPEGKTLGQKIGALGIENETAESLAEQIDKEFEREVNKRKSEVKEKVRRARADRKPLGLLATENEIDRAVRGELKRLDLRLGTIVKWHYTKVDATGQDLAKRLSSGLGLSDDGAAFLAARIEARFKQLATERKRAALERLPKSVKDAAVRRPEVIQKLIELSNLGAFTDEQFLEAAKERLGLPVMTPAVGAEITRRANELQKLPEGFQQQRAQIELINFIERQRGIQWQELALPFWFANVLSGPVTHMVNVVSNAFNLGAHTALEILKRPGATPQIIAALGRGMGKGLLEGAAVLQTGMRTGGAQLQKIRAGRALELYEFKGWLAPLKAWRYVWRAMAAEDMVFLKAGEEMRQAVAARVIAKKEGIRDRNGLTERVAEILGNTKAARSQAEAAARGEGLTGLDWRRRVNELIEQGRPGEMRETALDYAVRVTFNNEPTGVLGAIAHGVQRAVDEQPALRLLVPFINIIANVTNESLNYLPPVGFGRALYGTWFGKLDGKAIADKEQLYDQYAKATIGLLAITGVGAMAAKYAEDEDPPFAVNGAGPRTQDQRNQLKERGWIPYSVKIGGRYYSYATTPLAVPMAILGNYMDALKYKRLDQTSALNRVAYAALLSGRVITEQSFLNSIADMFELLGRDPTKSAGDAGARMFARMGAGFVVPNLLRQVDQAFDPTVYNDKGIEAALVNQVPFARRLNRPAINALGEPVEKYVSSRFTTAELSDELWRVLAEKQAWVPVVDRETIVGDRKRGEDYFRLLTPDEIYELTEMSGQRIRDRLEANLDRLIMLEPEQAQAFVQKITQEERDRAKRLLR